MRKGCIVLLFVMWSFVGRTQETVPPRGDSSKVDTLTHVVVTGFEQSRRPFNVPFSAKILRTTDNYPKSSLVTALNTVPGVRMEERSPGSYRLNIRGSSLRSPFGVRNVKVYWNEIPITDPGGNTYFNQFAFNNFSAITIFKGPAGSLYGAGTGGLILGESIDRFRSPGVELEYAGGSYGAQNVFATVYLGTPDNRSRLSFAHNEQDGYRVQSAMRRTNASWTSSFKISGKQDLMASVLFTDLYYQTPGGLTKAEFDKNPRAARPAAGGLPSAEQAKAAIYQKNLMAGINNRYYFNENWSNNTSIYVAYAQIKNPAVRNYERRSEPHGGGRTSFSWERKANHSALKIVFGGELQQGYFNTKVYQNKNGESDTLQTDDDIRHTTYSVFAQADLSIEEKWFLILGSSLNQSKVDITRLNKYPVQVQSQTYEGEWAPRISLLRKFGEYTSVLGIFSKGFSPPTTAELLPSTGVISTYLEAETGANYELVIRQYFLQRDLWFELSGYYFKLKNTLVQRRDLSGADYFVNAGDTKQKGIELSAEYSKQYSDRLVRYFSLHANWAYNHYRYGSFTKDTVDFSGKQLPSVPQQTIGAMLNVQLGNGAFLDLTYYYASKIFLNDANTAFAEPYHLLGGKIGWQKTLNKFAFKLYAGADNLMDEVYSLGNDINDARGRYYNTAAGRNYFIGIQLSTPGRR
ncbi:MAG TPA: TonB-dependent receptor [Chitinophagaceae bacterium]